MHAVQGSEANSRTDWRTMHGLIFFALTAAAGFVPGFRTWPLPWLVPLARCVASQHGAFFRAMGRRRR